MVYVVESDKWYMWLKVINGICSWKW